MWPPISFAMSSIDQIEALVNRQKSDGVDMIKAYVGLDLDMVAELVGIAADQGLRVIIHSGFIDQEQLAGVGIAAYAHLPQGLTDAALEQAVENGIFAVTTLAVFQLQRRLAAGLDFLDHPLIADTTPAFVLDELNAHAAAQGPLGVGYEQRVAATYVQVRRLHQAGVPLVAGTDAPYPGLFQGEATHRELELLVEAGLTPLEAITCATRNAARLMQADDEWGTLAAGLVADILVVSGRPDRTISDTRNIEMVIQRGRVLDRETLRYDPAKDPGFRAGQPVSTVR